MNPILLLHGALGAKTQLDPLKKILEESGRKVYTLNLSGHGGEPFQISFGIETFASGVIRFMNKSKITKADIFGYSMGGYVALWLAHKFPERLGSITALGTKFDWSPESAEKEVKKLNVDKILGKVPAFVRILEHRHEPNDWKELVIKTGDMMLRLGKQPLLTEEIVKSISIPIKICLGDQDDMADRSYSEKVAKWLPSGSFRLVENTPHPLEKVDPGILIKLILD